MVANGYLPVSGMDTYYRICEVSEIEKVSSSCLESYVNGRSSPGGSLAWLAKRKCIIVSRSQTCFVYIIARDQVCISISDQDKLVGSRLQHVSR